MTNITEDERVLVKSEEQIDREVQHRGLTGVPSVDKAWRKFYSKEELGISVPDMSLTEYIYQQNKDRMFLNALTYFQRKVKYEELFERIEQASKRFKKYGVREEDYVALAMPLTPEVIYMLYGLDNIGACANLVDPRIPEERMRFYLELTGARLAAITQPYIGTMRNAARGTTVEDIINIPILESLTKDQQREVIKRQYQGAAKRELIMSTLREELKNNIQNAISLVGTGAHISSYGTFFSNTTLDQIHRQPNGEKIALGEFTSGTTGVPKGLGLTARGMNLTAEQLKMINRAKPGETILAIMPPFISYGAVTGIHNSLACGFDMIIIPKFTVESFAELVKKYKPNNIICVPSMFQYVIHSPLLEHEDMSFLKRVIFGGDRTIPEFEHEVNEWFIAHNANITLIKGGGMAEYSSCAFETPFEETKKPGIYGIPLPLVEVKIMKDDHTECGYYEIGEIYIHSPQQMGGYLNNQEATDEFFYTDEQGKKWGRSGDLGYIDTDGCVVHTGRKKQMIVRPDGHNVFPIEIEQVINRTGFVKNCVVIGVKDAISVAGEYPHAFIELKDEYLENAANVLAVIKKIVSDKIPLRDRPRDEDYHLTTLVFAQEGKLDREATLKKVMN
ncbi:MAG: acyl--CoA ligase [Bacilli bacterium]|nr:acyl--CoA ligase [Bacilli bacterium]